MHRMHVVIGGYGRVGQYLARMLEFEGHSVAVIDSDPGVFKTLGQDILGPKFVGQVFDRSTLEQAGIARADVFCAVTSGDNSNVVSARTAKDYYKVPRVVARIYDPRRAEIYRKLGIPTVASVTWTSTRLLQLISHSEVKSEFQFGNGEFELLEVELPPVLKDHRVADLDIHGEIRVTSIVRGNAAMMPTEDTVFQMGDRVYAIVARESIGTFERLLDIN
jgi:trk system potassium uptake protein TrkA